MHIYLLYGYWQTVRLLQGWRVAWRAKSGHSEHSGPPNCDKHTICISIASGKCLHVCFVLLKGKHVTHDLINYNLISPYTLPDCDTIPPTVLSYTRNRQNHSVSLAGLWNTRATYLPERGGGLVQLNCFATPFNSRVSQWVCCVFAYTGSKISQLCPALTADMPLKHSISE